MAVTFAYLMVKSRFSPPDSLLFLNFLSCLVINLNWVACVHTCVCVCANARRISRPKRRNNMCWKTAYKVYIFQIKQLAPTKHGVLSGSANGENKNWTKFKIIIAAIYCSFRGIPPVYTPTCVLSTAIIHIRVHGVSFQSVRLPVAAAIACVTVPWGSNGNRQKPSVRVCR